MLIKLELLKKESTMIVGGGAKHEYETCAMKLSTLMSAGEHSQYPEKWSEVFFMGLPAPLTVNTPFNEFVEYVNTLSHGRWDDQDVESQPRTFSQWAVDKSLAEETR